jgi:hypothetical protein
MSEEPKTPAEPTPSGAPAPPGALARAWKKTKHFLIWTVIVLVAGFALYLFVALKFSYSSGDRAGFVQKFSKKGWVCKTWEGELALVNLPGAMPEIFRFTVRDDAVASQVNEHLGARVTLTYEQHPPLPSCFGETQHFVTDVREIEP